MPIDKEVLDLIQISNILNEKNFLILRDLLCKTFTSTKECFSDLQNADANMCERIYEKMRSF